MFTTVLTMNLLFLPFTAAAPVVWCKPAEISRFLQRYQDQLSTLCPQYIDQTAVERITIPSAESETVNDIVNALDDARIATRDPASAETDEDPEGGDNEPLVSDVNVPSSDVAAACGCRHNDVYGK